MRVCTIIELDFDVSEEFAEKLCNGKLTPYEQARFALARLEGEDVEIRAQTWPAHRREDLHPLR